MKNFDTRTYSISDFIEWDKNGLLELSPDFLALTIMNIYPLFDTMIFWYFSKKKPSIL